MSICRWLSGGSAGGGFKTRISGRVACVFAGSIQPRQLPGHAGRAAPVGHNARGGGKSWGECSSWVEGHLFGRRKRIAGKFLSLEVEGLSK